MLNVPEELKEILKTKNSRNELVIHFPNGEFDDITNDNIASESLGFTESICSGDELEFGLAEASVLKFSTIGIDNAKGKEIEATLYIDAGHPIDDIETVIETIVDEDSYFDCFADVNIDVRLFNDGDIIITTDTEMQSVTILGHHADGTTGISYINHHDNKICIIEESDLYDNGSNVRFTNIYQIHVIFASSDNKIKLRYNKRIQHDKYPLKIGRFVVTDCKRNTSNLQYRDITAISENTMNISEVFELYADIVENSGYPYDSIPDNYRGLRLRYTDVKNLCFRNHLVNNASKDTLRNNGREYTYTQAVVSDTGRECTVEVTGYVSDSVAPGWIYVFRNIGREPFNKSIVDIAENVLEDELGNISYVEEETEYGTINNIFYDVVLKAGAHLVLPCGGAQFGGNSGFASIKNKKYDFGIYETDDYVVVPFPHYDNTDSSSDIQEGFVSNYYYESKEISDGKYEVFGPYKIPPILWLPTKIVIKNSRGTILAEYNAPIVCDIEYRRNLFGYIPTNEPYLQLGQKKVTDEEVYSFSKVDGKYITNQTRNITRIVLPDISELRNITETFLAVNGAFGKIDRDGNYIELRFGADMTYPSSDLFPGDDVFPGGIGNIGNALYTKKIYKECWFDDVPTLPYGAVKAKYTDIDGNENEITVYRQDIEDFDEYKTYDLSNNMILTNGRYSESTIRNILNNFMNAIKDIQYMPTSMNAVGLPYVEAGDFMMVLTSDNSVVKTYMLRRELHGIQSLTDSITSN